MKHSLGVVLLLAALSAPVFGQERIILRAPGDAAAEVELFVSVPDGDGPWPAMLPAILYVHGHQIGARPGAHVFARLGERPRLASIDEGRQERMAERGYVAAAVSMPGYGGSSGPPDSCGPRTQAAVETALSYLWGQPFVDRDRIDAHSPWRAGRHGRSGTAAGGEAEEERRLRPGAGHRGVQASASDCAAVRGNRHFSGAGLGPRSISLKASHGRQEYSVIQDFVILVVFATTAFFVAGTIKGTVGIGLPTASLGILAQGFDPRMAVALVVFPMMVSNAWQVFRMGEPERPAVGAGRRNRKSGSLRKALTQAPASRRLPAAMAWLRTCCSAGAA